MLKNVYFIGIFKKVYSSVAEIFSEIIQYFCDIFVCKC